MKRLLLITSGDVNKASVRVRVLNYLPLLEKTGWSVEVVAPSRDKRRQARLRELLILARKTMGHDAVLMQKRCFPA